MSESENTRQGLFLSTFGMATLATTYLASRGLRHSQIHKELASIAMKSEAITIGAGLVLLATKDQLLIPGLKRTGQIGFTSTVLCFAAVALTDSHLPAHFKSGKGFSQNDFTDLGLVYLKDARRQLSEGIKYLTPKF